MSHPYVSLTDTKPVMLSVNIGAVTRTYPLTKAGCIKAGVELNQAGAENWLCSSSVDFPHEYKKGFKHDVRGLMSQGWQAEQERKEAPQKRLFAKMLVVCSGRPFQAGLDEEEKAAFVVLKQRFAQEG